MDRKLSLMLFIFEREIVCVDESAKLGLSYHFSERFSETDTPTADKRHVAVRIAFFTFWRVCIGTVRVEAFWNKLTWFDPLLWIVVQAIEEYCDVVTLTNLDVTHFGIL